LLVKPTPRNVNLGNGRFAMFNKERDISSRPIVFVVVHGPVSRKGSIAHLALAAYAAGNASDHPIASLILTEENTANYNTAWKC
jgi:hypothetical protein